MSYILDALKKSEQERGHGRIPDVQTIHSSSLAYRREKRAWWPYLLIAAITLNLAAIVYFNLDKNTTASTAGKTAVVATATPPEAASATVPAPAAVTVTETGRAAQSPSTEKAAIPVEDTQAATAGVQPAPHSQAVAKRPATKARSTSTPPSAPAAAPVSATKSAAAVIDYNDLPESFRQQLPAFRITAHVYSSNPQQRSVVINNNFMEEGEYVLDGLVLYEITKTGVIFSYHDTLFHYNVVSGWQ